MAPGGEWQLEAGALVLADGGICCIDEFNSIRESERASIHEAMEQQTLSVAKAGMVCKLSTVCSILAATNPKGRYDTAHPITVNCAIASPLLSRFDLVFVLLDRKNRDWDSRISSYIIQDKTSSKSATSELWNVEKLQAYFMIVKNIQPRLSENASLILKEYYRVQRRNEMRSASRITVRLLESLVRLAQAHAKFMFRNEVTVQDAVVSVALMESSHQTSSIDAYLSNPIQTTAPLDPEEEYIELAHRVLGNIGLEQMLDEEIKNYTDNCNNQAASTGTNDRSDFDQLSQIPPSKSDLAEKLNAVFNNIKQNKRLEEHKVLVFQQKGANKKRKKRTEQGKSRKGKKKIFVQEDISNSSSSSGDEENGAEEKVAKGRNKRVKSIDVSGYDSTDFMNNSSPLRSNGAESGRRKPPTEKMNAVNEMKTDSDITSKSLSKQNFGSEKNANGDLSSPTETPDGKTSTQIPSASKKTPIAKKTMSKLKAFTFKSPNTSDEITRLSPIKSTSALAPESPTASVLSQVSSKSCVSSEPNINTQRSIFCIDDDMGDSDYEL